ncbi:MAG: DUF4339 domain-containing protein [Hyphomonadaceae bacterium]
MPSPPANFSDSANPNASFAMIAHSRGGAPRNDDSQGAAAEKRVSQALEGSTDWWVQVRESAYGPYTEGQIRQFITEGRVKPSTMVSRDRRGDWKEARATAPFVGALAPQASPAAAAQPELANVFIFAEIHSGAWTAFMAAVETLGRVAELAPGFWLVRTKFSSGVIRNTLSQTLERGDRFVVVDATKDRLAWYNMGPGIDVSIREIWNGGIDR